MPDLTPGSDQPPLDEWEQREASHALVQLAVDLTVVDDAEARRRLGRLTARQREWVLDRFVEGDDNLGLPPSC